MYFLIQCTSQLLAIVLNLGLVPRIEEELQLSESRVFHNNISWTLVINWCHLSRKWLHSIFSEFPLRKIQHLFVTTKTDRFFSFLRWVKRPRDITPLLASVFCYAQVVRLTVPLLLTTPFILTVTSGYFRRLRKTSVLFVTTGITEKKMR